MRIDLHTDGEYRFHRNYLSGTAVPDCAHEVYGRLYSLHLVRRIFLLGYQDQSYHDQCSYRGQTRLLGGLGVHVWNPKKAMAGEMGACPLFSEY
jgi:hypothetical protein